MPIRSVKKTTKNNYDFHRLLFKKISKRQLIERVEIANSMIEAEGDPEAIFDAIDEVILFAFHNGSRVGAFSGDHGVLCKDSKIYRIRGLNSFDEFYSEKDFWAPGSEYVKKAGRLNFAGESLLYCSENPLVAMDEAGVESGGLFLLMAYGVYEDIQLNSIGDSSMSPKDFRGKLSLITDFLEQNFYRNESSYYFISNYISKRFLDFSHGGFSYKSVKNKTAFNFCLNKNGFDKLRLINAFGCRRNGDVFGSIGRCLKEEDRYRFEGYACADDLSRDEKLMKNWKSDSSSERLLSNKSDDLVVKVVLPR